MIFVLLTAGLAYWLHRNRRVLARRQKLLASISAINHAEVNAVQTPGELLSLDILRRHKDFETVSYGRMFLSFWVPIGSWFSDRDWWIK